MSYNRMLTKADDVILRPISCEFSVLGRPDGSASFSQGSSSVIAAVYGPAEVRTARELIDRAVIEAVYQPKVGQSGPEGRAIQKRIGSVCEAVVITRMHPHTQFTVIIQEVQNAGSLLSCCINAACAALLNASAPMRYTVAAVTCVTDANGDIIVDPTIRQETDAVATHTFVFESSALDVISCLTTGTVSEQLYHKCHNLARDASRRIFDVYREKYNKLAVMTNSESR